MQMLCEEALTDRQASCGAHAHDAGAWDDRHLVRHQGSIVVTRAHDEANVYVLLVLEVPQLAINILHAAIPTQNRLLRLRHT